MRLYLKIQGQCRLLLLQEWMIRGGAGVGDGVILLHDRRAHYLQREDRRAKRLLKSFAGLPVVCRLADPNLRNEFCVNGWQRRMQRHLIEHSVNRGGEEHQRHASSRLNI